MSNRYFIAPDEHGVPELWHDTGKPGGPQLVAWQYGHLKRSVSVQQDYGELLWRVVAGVLAPDDATVERVARALHDHTWATDWHDETHEYQRAARDDARAVLAALADPDGGAA